MWRLIKADNQYILIETDSTDTALGWILTKRSGAWSSNITELCGNYRKEISPENLYKWVKE